MSDVIEALIAKIHIVKDEAALSAFFEKISPGAVKGPVRIAFVNAHAVNLCFRRPDFLADILACDYVLRDGAGMKLLYKMMGREPGLNLNGTDLIPRILALYKGQDVSLMGTDAPYLDTAAAKISAMGLNTVTVMNGFHDSVAYTKALAEKPVPLVVLAMGMPKQEHVASKIASETSGACLILCGGAILDFMGEKVTRAPSAYRDLGLEWLYRLIQEPRRLFGRYVIGNAMFLARAARFSLSGPERKPGDRPKILHVVRQFYPAIGGLESYVLSMAMHQKAMGYDCEVLTLDRIFHGAETDLQSYEDVQGIRVKRVGFWGRRRFFIPKVSPFYFRGFDIVHVHNTDVFYDYVALVAGATGVPCVATTHGGFFHTKDFSLIKKIYFNTVTRFSSLFYKTIFAISQNDFDTFKGLNKSVVLQHNAVEPLGDTLSQGQDFLYIGRLAAHKNVAKVIDVFAALVNNHAVPGTLRIIGPSWDVSIEELQTRAQKAGLADRVVFHGSTESGEMREIVKSCGFFLSASSFEGFGMSMLEAMSVGMIPFVQPNESFRELVTAAGVGLCVDYNDVQDAAAQIAGALSSVTNEQRERARAFALEFSWQGLVEKTDETYRKYL